jgi:hypothetical protein
MRAALVGVLFLYLLCLCVAKPLRPVELTGSGGDNNNVSHVEAEDWCVGANGIVCCGSARVAGAIDYVAWNNMQFINAYDHGRELQIAITNASGECYNPTEAGSSNDGPGPTTTSKLLGISTSGNVYRTTTLPAFWLAPRQRDPNGCIAVNTQYVSSYSTSKAITIGYLGVWNAMQYLISITVPEFQAYLQVEAPTGYMPENFNSFWLINLANGQLSQVNTGPAETLTPVIIATPDQQYAMGAYLASAMRPYVHYARFNFPNSYAPAATSKWSVVWRDYYGIAPGTTVSFETIICIGSLQQVQTCMVQMASKTGYVTCTGAGC